MNMKLSASLAALVLSGAMAAATPASAQRWNHGGWGWGGPAAAGAAGLATGAIIGGAIASGAYGPGYYGYGYGPGYAPGYDYGSAYGYEPGPGVAATETTVVPGGGDASAYCAQRFRSYDPATGTYMGYDGVRRSCP